MAMSFSEKTQWKYLLSPVSARAHIKRDRSENPLRSTARPRIVLDLQLDQVPMSITDVSFRVVSRVNIHCLTLERDIGLHIDIAFQNKRTIIIKIYEPISTLHIVHDCKNTLETTLHLR